MWLFSAVGLVARTTLTRRDFAMSFSTTAYVRRYLTAQILMMLHGGLEKTTRCGWMIAS